ncbi:TonB-dependent siderophore receptor [Pseudoalteromonas sp. NEC-BIFX-2020_015]|uniref:TonB-dependent siderophore receptor n=1 Tax=Pseudoalteromonas sp. NEC-BIFX-2020_015 TaxID=2729544 RepID=UPI0014616CD8|nr:TonB-dependent siderophore receptor [Pseudoalteromonas sp. NEC-BIFX-2020_015]NMR25681.1 TonB-dependent siderophore receptor [Pseudoalteromonas sp. NEC-BIFX-2020_015]
MANNLNNNESISCFKKRHKHYSLALAVAAAFSGQAFATQEITEKKNENQNIEVIEVKASIFSSQNPTPIPLTAKELPQSVSSISRELMDLSGITDINDVMLNVPGVNVTQYDSQRPLYFARGFQITDFQVDGIPTFSGSTNQEYDTSLYQQIEVIRGANGLLSGVGSPSATVNMIRKRPKREFDASVSAGIGSWDRRRGVADVSIPLTKDGSVRSRLVVAYQDSDSYLNRYQENKIAMMGIVEAEISHNTTVSLGYQNQDNNPEGTTWGTIPIFASDGKEAKLPVTSSYAPKWTKWQRESATVFADIEHHFNDYWKLRGALNHTKGDVNSLRVYASGFPDRKTGEGLILRGAVGFTEDTRDSLDLYLTGNYTLLDREHDIMFGANISQTESTSLGYTSLSGWSYNVPDAWDFNGEAPSPSYTKTGAYRTSETDQYGFYAASRFRVTDLLSLVGGARISYWETGTDNYDTSASYVSTTGDYKVSNEITPYVGIVYELTPSTSLYASYTDIFTPQNSKDKNNNLLAPVLGSNLEAGIKSELYDGQLMATFAVFNAKQDNYGVRDLTQPDYSLPDGSSAYKGVDGTESKGIEISLSGHITPDWIVNAGYSYVDTTRNENDRIWTNLPEHSAQLSTHYQFSGTLEQLNIGAGINWQSEITGYSVNHPLFVEGVTHQQDAYMLINLYANWRFNKSLDATFSATNVTDETYWANIDFANYGEPQNINFTLKWVY